MKLLFQLLYIFSANLVIQLEAQKKLMKREQKILKTHKFSSGTTKQRHKCQSENRVNALTSMSSGFVCFFRLTEGKRLRSERFLPRRLELDLQPPRSGRSALTAPETSDPLGTSSYLQHDSSRKTQPPYLCGKHQQAFVCLFVYTGLFSGAIDVHVYNNAVQIRYLCNSDQCFQLSLWICCQTEKEQKIWLLWGMGEGQDDLNIIFLFFSPKSYFSFTILAPEKNNRIY